MSGWSQLLAELERIDFELRREAKSDVLCSWMERRAGLLASMPQIDVMPLEPAEHVRLAQAVERGRELLEQWGRRRARLHAEAGNLYALHRMLQALQPARGAHFSIDS